VTHPLQTGLYATWSGGSKKEVSKEGTAHFDAEPVFPSVALFLDASYALILKEGPGDTYVRVGRATFSRKADEADKVDMPKGAVREATIV
jgi:hypothetical protein